MDETRLSDRIRRDTRFARLAHAPSCNSTQALSMEDGGRDWAIFWSDHQTAGRGRQGRSWSDAPGQDLTVTFRLTGLEISSPARLAAVIPVAILRTLRPRIPEIRIKWPNDLLLGGRKICGILIDSKGQPPNTHHVGIGINTNRTSFPDDLVANSTSLALAVGEEFDRGELLYGLALELDKSLRELETNQLQSITEEFRDSLGLMTQPVRITTGKRVFEGRLAEVDLDSMVLDGGPRIALAHVQALQRL